MKFLAWTFLNLLAYCEHQTFFYFQTLMVIGIAGTLMVIVIAKDLVTAAASNVEKKVTFVGIALAKTKI